MIGMSLSFKDLLATDDVVLKPETLLPKLREDGKRWTLRSPYHF